ncbi:hypothetical protein C2E23DRAFT_322921 [Lenzites betulinus]|nr:hypothetical protein C2E23DRAFT_322921 [Lenzites betulinus]
MLILAKTKLWQPSAECSNVRVLTAHTAAGWDSGRQTRDWHRECATRAQCTEDRRCRTRAQRPSGRGAGRAEGRQAQTSRDRRDASGGQVQRAARQRGGGRVQDGRSRAGQAIEARADGLRREQDGLRESPPPTILTLTRSDPGTLDPPRLVLPRPITAKQLASQDTLLIYRDMYRFRSTAHTSTPLSDGRAQKVVRAPAAVSQRAVSWGPGACCHSRLSLPRSSA